MLAPILAAAVSLSPAALWDAWPAARFVHTAAPCLRHAELVERLQALEAKHRGRLTLEEVGRSFESRAIHLLTVGHGPRRVLLWSQMHGDEPSATPALLDLADFLLSRSAEPEVRRIMDRATLLLVPMLNPDGAERYQRRNAQGIDVNRDALSLATPEGRLLKALRERYRPELGFNLHDQSRRTTVGDSGQLATISLLAVAGDARGTLTPGRRRAKRVCASLVTALGPFVPRGIARYDEDWNPRAFGDNLTKWGTPVVLIESGGLPAGLEPTDLSRLNFVGLVSVLRALVQDDLAGFRERDYDTLARNTGGTRADVIVRRGHVVGPGREPYLADIAFDVLVGDQARAGCAGARRGGSRIVEIGDARHLAASQTVDAAGEVILPGLTVAVHGLSAREWLDARVLDRLGGMGVATVRWTVAPAEIAEAGRRARDLEGDGRPALVATAAADESVGLPITGPPEAPASPTLGDVIQALARKGPGEPRSAQEALARATAGNALAPDAPASFIVLGAATVGPASDPLAMRIEQVWIDGRSGQ